MISREVVLSAPWPHCRLGEVVEFLDHLRKPVKESERVPGPYPYYGANGQQGTINSYLFDEPLLLMAEDGGHFGIPGRTIAYCVDGKCWVNNHAHVLRPREDVDMGFLCYQLAYYDVTPFITGTTRGKLTKQAARAIPVALPPLDEQKRIAAILDKASQGLQKRREAIKLLDEFLRAAFLEMFGDPVTNPKGWEKKAFGDCIESIRYATGSPPPYIDYGIPFIRATNIKGGTIVFNELKFISHEDAAAIAKCRVKTGDLILVRSGVNAGDCAVIPQEFDGAYAAYDLIIELNKFSAIFFNYLINSDYGRALLTPLKRRAGQPHLNADQIKSLVFPFPPLSEQQKFAALVEKVESLRAKQRQSEQELELLFKSLMQRAFRGELTVNKHELVAQGKSEALCGSDD